MTLYILTYNNYYNRLVKKEDTLEKYQEFVVYELENTNFNPNDGLDTQHIIGQGEYNGEGDYVLIVENNELVSRWFIVNSERSRAGQYNLTLHRDVIVDYYNIIRSTPIFIEKATLKENDPFIFNPEDGMSFNQIKKKETLIKDATECSWIVAYIAREKANGDEFSISGSASPVGAADIVVDRESWEFKDYLENPMAYSASQFNFNFNFRIKPTYGSEKFLQVNLFKSSKYGTVSSSFNRNSQSTYINSSAANYTDSQFNNEFKDTYNEILDYLPTASKIDFKTDEIANDFKNLNGATVKFTGEDTVYRISIKQQTKTHSVPFSNNDGVSSSDLLYLKVQPLWKSVLTYANPQHAIAVGRFYEYSFTYEELSLELTPIGVTGDVQYNVSAARTHLTDAPYDMICAPYESVKIKITDTNGTKIVDCNSEYIQTVFNDIAVKFAGGDAPVVYDIQRLPYCPINTLQKDPDGIINALQYSDEKQVFTITKDNTDVGLIFACSTSNFYKSIMLDEPIVVNNAKIQSSCDVYRICSPNYSGVFELDVAMNGGLNSFNIYCSYKPYNPYIQVSPNFGLLYGENFDDSRGLICGGEWSLPIVSSQWATYERNNVNYNNIFQRQIENLKVTQNIERHNDIATAILGTAQGVLGGAALGGFTGMSKAGLAVGAGIASGLGGVADIVLKERLRKETLDYTQDMYAYQMGNIKALAQSLSRTSAFTINNKIFPFLEYYTCTDEEKEAFAYKIAYNGMTVMRIGKLADYEGNLTDWSYNDITSKGYFKGRLIRLTDIQESYQITSAINEEINRGFYYDSRQY